MLLFDVIDVFIDLIDVNLWFLKEVCGVFEDVFDFWFDNDIGLYLVNDI